MRDRPGTLPIFRVSDVHPDLKNLRYLFESAYTDLFVAAEYLRW